jgi:hypothetical protein
MRPSRLDAQFFERKQRGSSPVAQGELDLSVSFLKDKKIADAILARFSTPLLIPIGQAGFQRIGSLNDTLTHWGVGRSSAYFPKHGDDVVEERGGSLHCLLVFWG